MLYRLTMTTFIPDIDTLIRYLAHHCAAPQPAERWAMYRLITPVVDLACQTTGWRPFFEYNQTSAHHTSQSVDIALLDDGMPRVLIEAKRARRPISRQQIEKYLEPGLSGIVSNGTDWILCRDELGHHVRIWDEAKQRVSRDDLEHVVAFITDGVFAGDQIDSEMDILPILHPDRPLKARRAARKQHAVESIGSSAALLAFCELNKRLTHLDRDFLTAFAEAFSEVPDYIRIEVRETRMSVWNVSNSGKDREMRIEFGKRHPSVIVKSSIVAAQAELSEEFVHIRHDKHGGMREFRAAETLQARSLRHKVASIFSKDSR